MPLPPEPSPPDPFPVEAVRAAAGLATLEHLREADSTMTRARAIAADPRAPLPAAVVADRQTSGRGRRGAGWWQAPGSLAASLVVDGAPRSAPGGGAVTALWSLACGVALAETVRALEPGVEARVRWPNDVVVGPRKIAGILVETAPQGRIVIGVGVNTAGRAGDAPEPLRQRVATLEDITGRMLPRERLLGALVPALLGAISEASLEPRALVARYRPLCSLSGTFVTLHREDGRTISGPCLGIDADGALVLDTAAGPIHLVSGSLTDPREVWRGAGAAPR